MSRPDADWTTGLARKGRAIAMDSLLSIIATMVLIVGPLAALALAAWRYGADSRPGIGDRDQRPWLVPTN
jgi:hypothetical protein